MRERLDAAVKKLKKDFNVPSIMIGVFKDGETFFCGDGLSDVENRIAATPDTIYAIASSSKPFVSTSLCILADDGKLCLDDPVKKHLPDFEMHDPYMTGHLTIRDAMSHRSGLPRHDLVWMNRRGASLSELAYSLKYLPPAFEPRTKMYYQNIMFILGCVIIEKAGGMPWGDFVKARLLDPLGMSHTYTEANDYRGKCGEYESQPYALKDGIPAKVDFPHYSAVGGAGCMSSSVRDLVQWVRLHLGKGEFEGKRIFSEKMAAELHSPQTIIRPGDLLPFGFDEIEFENYCLGWFAESYRGHKFVHHGGTINGYKSQVGFLPRQNAGFAILTNLGANQSPNSLGYIICDMVLGLSEIDWGSRYITEIGKLMETMKGGAQKIADSLKEGKAPARPLEDYTGKYSHPAYGEFELRLDNDALKARMLGGDVVFMPCGYDSFYIPIMNETAYIQAQFRSGFEGNITGAGIKMEGLTDMIEFNKINREGI
ncbi:MAG: serine hydrolase [Defluviitaleaceae bacterium]|nr:serine hydrolase [Defluviitaleaceae bacterium]